MTESLSTETMIIMYADHDVAIRSVSSVHAHIGGTYQGVSLPRLLYAPARGTRLPEDYTQVIHDAIQHGDIDASEHRRLLETDIVFIARLYGVTQMFAVEAASTLGRIDIDRALTSARLLPRAFRGKRGPESGCSFGEVQAHAIVTGEVVPDSVRGHAEAEGVAVVVIERPR